MVKNVSYTLKMDATHQGHLRSLATTPKAYYISQEKQLLRL